jgi:hypothetical protein
MGSPRSRRAASAARLIKASKTKDSGTIGVEAGRITRKMASVDEEGWKLRPGAKRGKKEEGE